MGKHERQHATPGTELHSVCSHGLTSSLQVSIALQKDGTVAVQTALDKALVQWPFLHDTSLVAATAAVFMPAASHSLSQDAARSAAQAAAANALDVTLLQPWLYNNVLLLNSQLFIPVLDKVRLLSPATLSSEDFAFRTVGRHADLPSPQAGAAAPA